jgi:hypothetical protein
MDPPRVEIITGRERRRRYTGDQTLRLVEGATHCFAQGAEHDGLCRRPDAWSLAQPAVRVEAAHVRGGKAAIQADGEVVAARRLREPEGCIRDRERSKPGGRTALHPHPSTSHQAKQCAGMATFWRLPVGRPSSWCDADWTNMSDANVRNAPSPGRRYRAHGCPTSRCCAAFPVQDP